MSQKRIINSFIDLFTDDMLLSDDIVIIARKESTTSTDNIREMHISLTGNVSSVFPPQQECR